MHTRDISAWVHTHRYETGQEQAAERRTRLVMWLTVAMMVAEIAVGAISNSMALLADGFHMFTHAGAFAIAVFAYRHARRHAEDRRYSFGTGKVGVLAGFASAIVLVMVALAMVWESAVRFIAHPEIAFDEALLVAVIGLIVNVLSAVALSGADDDEPDHAHARHDTHGHDHDHNLHAAYVHVLADAFTSVLAIVALLCGKYLGWWWLDPAMGLVGAVVIARWAVDLMRRTGGILVDRADDSHLAATIATAVEGDADNRIVDLHLWQVGAGRWAAIVSLVTSAPRAPHHYKRLLNGIDGLAHVTVEVHVCADH